VEFQQFPVLNLRTYRSAHIEDEIATGSNGDHVTFPDDGIHSRLHQRSVTPDPLHEQSHPGE